MDKKEFDNMGYRKRTSILLSILSKMAAQEGNRKDIKLFSAIGAVYTHSSEQREIMTELIGKQVLMILEADESILGDMPESLRKAVREMIQEEYRGQK